MAFRNKGHYLVFQMERALLIIEKSDLAKDAVMSLGSDQDQSSFSLEHDQRQARARSCLLQRYRTVPDQVQFRNDAVSMGTHAYRVISELHLIRYSLVPL